MNKQAVYCEVCGRQIIRDSSEDTERTIGKNYGNGSCLVLVKGIVCPKCTPEEIEFGEIMENS